VVGYEEGYGTIPVFLFDMSEGKSRASKTRWNSTAFGNTDVEME